MRLDRLEELLRGPLAAALPAGVTLELGPGPAPAASAPAVRLSAVEAILAPPDGETGERQPVFATVAVTLKPTPGQRDVELPADGPAEVVAVDAPGGQRLLAGNDWSQNGRSLRFRHPLEQPVTVRLRGGPMDGWQVQHSATVMLRLSASAAVAATADALLEAGLSAVLVALDGSDALDLGQRDPPGVAWRLLVPTVAVTRLGRLWSDGAVRVEADLTLTGRLETVLIRGRTTVPAPVIQAVSVAIPDAVRSDG